MSQCWGTKIVHSFSLSNTRDRPCIHARDHFLLKIPLYRCDTNVTTRHSIFFRFRNYRWHWVKKIVRSVKHSVRFLAPSSQCLLGVEWRRTLGPLERHSHHGFPERQPSDVSLTDDISVPPFFLIIKIIKKIGEICVSRFLYRLPVCSAGFVEKPDDRTLAGAARRQRH